MMFRVYLRSHNGVAENRTVTPSPAVAMAAFRELLARSDLEGGKWAAVFSAPRLDSTGGNSSTYFSRFDRPVGDGRIAPDDPRLDPLATREAADRVMSSLPGRE